MNDPRSKPVPSLWATPIEAWLSHLRAAGQSRQTLATRRDQLSRAARALAGDPWTVTERELVEWCGAQDWARETRRSVYAGLRSFWRWAMGAGYVERSPAAALPAVRPSDPLPAPGT